MKMINRIVALLAVAVLAVGCFSDKGDNEIRDINGLTISFTDDQTTINVVDGELIEFEATIKFNSGSGDIDHLKFEWKLDGEVMPEMNTLKFSWRANGLLSSKTLQLNVFDTNTGITYFQSLTLTVKSRYNQDGLQIIADKNGKTEFSYLRFTKYKSIVDDIMPIEQIDPFLDVYTMENGEALPAGAVGIVEHFCSDKTTIGQMLLLTKGGGFDANGMDYKKEVDLGALFEGGTYPAEFGYPSDAFGMTQVDLVANAQGNIYTRIKNNQVLFHSGEYLDQRLEVEGEEVTGCRFVPAPFSSLRACMVYDANKKRMFLITDANSDSNSGVPTLYAGHPYLLKDAANVPEGFVSINNLDGINIISMNYIQTNTYNGIGYAIVFERDGKTFFQSFEVDKSWGRCEYAILNPQIDEIKGLPGIPTYAYPMPYFQNKTALLAVGNELWIYDFGNKITAIKYGVEFSSPIVTMDGENFRSRCLGLALEDGTVYLVNAVKMSNPDNKLVYYKSEESFGQVRQVCFKRLTGNSWSF